MNSQIKKTLVQAKNKINSIKNIKELDKVYIELFGKKGLLTNLTKQIKEISFAKRPAFGQDVNRIKTEIEVYLQKKRLSLKKQKPKFPIDITAPGKKLKLGHLHLISQAIDEIVAIFSKLGFSLESYPEVDWDWYAFESLNMPKNHPARDDWETFFVKAAPKPHFGNQVLTPHTSNGQVREMERVKTPPIRMLNIARCYRRQIDISHTPMFHQFEGLLVDENITIANLKGTLNYFTAKFFGPKRQVRLRPHYFRFTEPSFEVDVTCGVCLGRARLPSGQGCRFCKSGWVELGGAGMVHPKVLKYGNINPSKYTGFAFGWGIERTIAIKIGIGDIRLLYQNDIRFLEQF